MKPIGGDEGGHGLDTAANACGDDGNQPFRGTEGGEQFIKPVNEEGAGQLIEEIDEGAAQVDGEHENLVHGQEKDGDAKIRLSTTLSIRPKASHILMI